MYGSSNWKTGLPRKSRDINTNTGAAGLILIDGSLFLGQGDDGLETIATDKAKTVSTLPLEGYSHAVTPSGNLALIPAGFGCIRRRTADTLSVLPSLRATEYGIGRRQRQRWTVPGKQR